MENPAQSRLRRRRHVVDNLKRCPLCGALNADTNLKCIVCSWESCFDHRVESVCEALDLLIERCPGFAEEFAPLRGPNP